MMKISANGKKNKSHASTMKLLPLIISYRKTNKTEKKNTRLIQQTNIPLQ
jgi:hypothetical protein